MRARQYPYYVVALVATVTTILYVYGWTTHPTDGAQWVMERDTVVVRAVGGGSAAEKVGIFVGDRILTVDGKRATVVFPTNDPISRHAAVGSLLEYHVLRNGTLLEFHVPLQSTWSTAPTLFTLYHLLIFSVLTIGVFVLLKKRGCR